MTDWSGGYVTDLEYTYGFYKELAPNLQTLALSWSRTGAPSLSGKLTYCELGCGHGMSANILAAANPDIEFHATDFNPGQVAFARGLAASAQLDGSINAVLRTTLKAGTVCSNGSRTLRAR